jgi:hypothetical protein
VNAGGTEHDAHARDIFTVESGVVPSALADGVVGKVNKVVAKGFVVDCQL